MENIFKIIVTSDTHGNLPVIETPFDLLLLPGDVCPAHDHYYAYQINWFQNVFSKWINSLPFKDENSKVVMTWGNHDFVGERICKEELQCFHIETNYRVIILKNEEYDYEYLTDEGIKTLKIFGTPYCHIFGNWAFMVSDEKLKNKFSFIPENCDIVISHDAPSINALGTISEGHNKGYDAGNIPLTNAIKEKKPKYFFCGHIHSGNHTFENVDGTYMANVSFINEKYQPAYSVLEFDIDKITKEVIK